MEEAYANSSSWKDEFTVANIEPKVILQLLDEVETFMRINGVQDMTKRKLLELRINGLSAAVSGETAEFDATRWSRLSGGRQNEILTRLTAVRDELINSKNVQSSRPDNDATFSDGVSNKSVIWLAIFGVIFAATLLSLIR
jgi:hypothetical protein